MLPFPTSARRVVLGAVAATTSTALLGAVAFAVVVWWPASPEHGTSYSASELGIEVSRASRSGVVPPAPEPGSTVASGPSTTVPMTTMATIPPATDPPAPPPGSFVTPGERLGIAGCGLFPRDNAFHASIGRLPVHPDSDAMVAAGGGAGMTLNAGFSAGLWEGSRSGYPVNIADSRHSEIISVIPRQYVATTDADRHPVPVVPRFEGWPRITSDRHLLVVDPASCTSHEMIGVSPPRDNPVGAWFVDKAVKIDLGSNAYRSRGAVKVAGVSMLAGLVRYDEVVSGRLDHVISMSIPTARIGDPVWPARNSDGPNPDPAAPPMGTWFRLRADVDLSGLGPQAAVIARALQVHGGVLADTGGRFSMSGEPDVRWDDADLHGLRSLSLADFEAVDPSPMMTSRDSLRIR